MGYQEYQIVNHANWEARVASHAASDQYGLDDYVADPNHLSGVVRFDQPRLPELGGKSVLHLQCHIGTDTLSLARLGANVSGLDFSGAALEVAAGLAASVGQSISFVEADVYDAVEVLGAAQFDVVYTGIGALCWLPDIARWAETVAELLVAGGELFIREGHPMLWALDDPRPDGLAVLRFPYFESDPIRFVDDSTYTDQDKPLSAPETLSFNHGLAEIFNGLWGAGLEITLFEEHDSVPWPALGDEMELVGDKGEYRLRHDPRRLAASYTLRATKPDA